MAWLTAVMKVITAIPQLLELFEKLVDLYNQYQLDQIEDHYNKEAMRRKALINAISAARSREERKELSILLSKHTSGQLSDS